MLEHGLTRASGDNYGEPATGNGVDDDGDGDSVRHGVSGLIHLHLVHLYIVVVAIMCA